MRTGEEKGARAGGAADHTAHGTVHSTVHGRAAAASAASGRNGSGPRGVKQELLTAVLEKERFFETYLRSGASEEDCRLCPYYGKRWSCPPGLPDIRSYLERYERVCVLVLKISYGEELRAEAEKSPQAAAEIREQYYEGAKARLLGELLQAERKLPGSKLLGAGRCVLCSRCAREEGKPCRNPGLRRYSITGFGLDFGRLLLGEFGIPMLWAKKGLPEYDVAVSALFLVS